MADQKRREDALALCSILEAATGVEPVMWGSSIVGFGTLHYKYPSGREGDTPVVGFSPRKAALTIYGLKSYENNAEAVERLGPVTTGKGCVYIKDLAAIDREMLGQLARDAFAERSATRT
ncbi:MAG: DUF1801 domain-containing protein [Solirubrobacterales bacterium]